MKRTPTSVPHIAPQESPGLGAQRGQVDGLLHMNLAAVVAFDHAGVLQIDQMLLLQGAQLVQDLIGGVKSVKPEDHEIAHVVAPVFLLP